MNYYNKKREVSFILFLSQTAINTKTETEGEKFKQD